MLNVKHEGTILDPTRWYSFAQPLIYGSEGGLLLRGFLSGIVAFGLVIAAPAVWIEAGLVGLSISFMVVLAFIVFAWILLGFGIAHDGGLSWKNHKHLVTLINTYNMMSRKDRKELKNIMRLAYATSTINSRFKDELEIFEFRVPSASGHSIDALLAEVRAKKKEILDAQALQSEIDREAWDIVREINRRV